MTDEPPLIVAEKLEKHYPSHPRAIRVLDGVSLEVRAGERIAIQGESGSGKTTLLNILAALEWPEKGTVSWAGRQLEPGKELAEARARHVGLVFQSFYLVPELNVRENVMLPARVAGASTSGARERAEQLLAQVGLATRLKALPTQLSGGERQRVAVARALMNEPKVILADEPTGNLDERTGRIVMDMLLRATEAQKTALVVVTHSREYAALVGRGYHLAQGVLTPGLAAPAASV